MLVIRLLRQGKKHQASFKIVVTDKRKPPKAGVFVEQIGFINPITKEKNLNKERAQYWVSKGAQPSDTVWNILISEGAIEGKKRVIKIRPSKKVKEEVKPAVEEKKEEKPKEDAPVEEKPVEPIVEENPKEDVSVEAPVKAEAPAEEKKEDPVVEEPKE